MPPNESFLYPIRIADAVIPLSQSVDHVGIVYNNHQLILPHILDRISAHKKANAILKFSGTGNNDNTNLHASIRADHCF